MTILALNQQGITDFFKAYCADKGIRVHISDSTKVPCCDQNSNIYLPTPTITSANRFWGSAYHEAGHLDPDIRWTMDFLNEIETEQEHGVYNILIDYLSELNRHGYYRGRDEALYVSRSEICEERPDMFEKGAQVVPLLTSLMVCDMDARMEWQGHLPKLPYPPSIQGYVDSINGMSLGTLLAEILENKDKDKLRKLAQDILALDKPEQGDDNGEAQGEAQSDSDSGADGSPQAGGEEGEAPNNEGDNQEGEGEAGSSSGDGEDSSEQSPEGRGDVDGQDEDESDGGGSAGTGDGDVRGDGDSDDDTGDSDSGDAEQDVPSDTDGSTREGDKPDSPSDGGDSSRPESGGGWGKCTTQEEVTCALKDFGVNDNPTKEHADVEQGAWDDGKYIPVSKVDWHDRTEDMSANPSGFDGSYYEDDTEAITNVFNNSAISKSIHKYLTAQTVTRYAHGKRRGRVSTRSLHRMYGDNATPPAIFKAKEAIAIDTDTAVLLMVDCSGSMYGKDYMLAAASAVAMASTLRDLRIPCEVLGFTDNEAIQLYLYKRYGEMNVTNETLLQRFGEKRYMGCNADGESLLLGAERLMQQDKKNRVMIVCSDGSPAGSGIGDSCWYLKEVTRLIEEESPIKLYGIGIATTAVQQYYTNHCVVSNVSQLDEVLLPLMRDNVLK